MSKRIKHEDIVSRTEKVEQEKDEVLFNDACLSIDRNIQRAADNGMRQSAHTPHLSEKLVQRLMEEYSDFNPEIHNLNYEEDIYLVFRW